MRISTKQDMYNATFSRYYDSLMGDTASVTQLAKSLLTSTVPKKSHILELGCGTGTVLQTIPNGYDLSGIDNSEAMLAIARKKIPSGLFYLKDIRDFQLDKQYDAVLCIFDTINHVTKRSDWQKVFRNAHRHLKNDGVFIFDMNTLRRLKGLASLPAYVAKLDKTTMACVKISEQKNDLFTARFQIFEEIHSKKIHYTEQEVEETSFPRGVVEPILEKYFTIEKRIDPMRKRITQKTGRIFFVCRKKALA